MPRIFLKLAMLTLALALSACGEQADKSGAADKPVNIAEGGLKGMEKAKAVEGQLQQRAGQPQDENKEQK
jgi:hypothetical protein